MAYQWFNRELRAEVKKLHRRAGAKVSRTKKAHNIDIAGTSLDPRVPAKNIDRMNAKELRAYKAKVTTFLDRKTQYAKGAQGTTIDYDLFKSGYAPVERAYNRMVMNRRAEVDAIVLPDGETVGERRERTNKVQYGGPKYATGDILNDPYATIHRKPGFVKGDDALRIIIAEMQKKLNPAYKAEMVQKDRETIDKALAQMGLMDLKERFDSLSDDQFDILFNESSFAEYFFPRYIDMKSKMGQMETEEIEDKRNETLEDIEWASKITVVHPKALTKLADLNTMAPAKGIKLGQLFKD